MYLGISSRLEHSSPQDWASKHKALGLKSVNFPVSFTDGEDVFMAYKKAADEAGLSIAEVGVWRNTLAADPQERRRWIDYAIGQLRMADEIGSTCCVNVAGTPYGPRWDGGYRENFSSELWTMAVAMIREIIDTARPKHTKFCIESMPSSVFYLKPVLPERGLLHRLRRAVSWRLSRCCSVVYRRLRRYRR